MATLHAHLLGRFRCCSDGEAVSGLEGAKVQELLSYLLLHRDRPHPRETLAGILWGDRPGELTNPEEWTSSQPPLRHLRRDW